MMYPRTGNVCAVAGAAARLGFSRCSRARCAGSFAARANGGAQPGRALDSTAVECLVRKYAQVARIRKTVTPHVFRVTTATTMLRAGANVRHVQELLGHRSVATLDPYLKLTITELKAAHPRFHPRERGGELVEGEADLGRSSDARLLS